MAFIDVRDEYNDIEGVRFDDSEDYLNLSSGRLEFYYCEGDKCLVLCDKEDIDHFIKAVEKAKEIWG